MNINHLSSISTLFSSMNQTSSNNNNNMSLYSAFSEYSVIKSGAYRKLVKSYYDETGNSNSTIKDKL